MFQRSVHVVAALAALCMLVVPAGPQVVGAQVPLPDNQPASPVPPALDPLSGPAPLLPEVWSPLGPEPTQDRIDPDALSAWIDGVVSELPEQEQQDPYAAIDACVAYEMQQQQIPGASIAIAVNGVITYTKGYGVKHLENGGDIDAETMFRIGSTTKMMTAAALMTLVDAGKVDLHAPITDYLPGLRLAAPWDASTITPHHLLTHSGGLPDNYLLYSEAQLNSVSLADWAEYILPYVPLNAPPGSFWNYSNPNFSLAGLIVERVSGVPVADYVEQNVWEKAGMPLTTFHGDEVLAHGNFAWGHYGNERLTPDRFAMPPLAPAGTAFSTPTEMVKWALTLIDDGGEVLSPASAAAMQASQINRDYTDWLDYGYGIFVTEYQDVSDPSEHVIVYDHGGNVQGWGSQLYWVPSRGIAVSILDNTLSSMGYSAGCVLEQLAGVEPRSFDGLVTDPETWGEFEGTYAMMNQVLWDFTVRITRDGDHLIMSQLDLGGGAPLTQALRDMFMIDADRDGRADEATASIDYTFIHDRADPEAVRWLRYRMQVGERVGQFPAEVPLAGMSCSPLNFTPEIDMPSLAVRASGLVQPGGEVLQDLPIAQDDPRDPSTASYKHDVRIRGEAGLFFAVARPQAGDNLELYLLHDADGDGTFAFPDEVVDVGLQGGGNARVMLLVGRQPAGDYQLWVHGNAIQGDDHTFTLQLQVMDGDQLRVQGAPTSVTAGQNYELQVCATMVQGLDEPMAGLVEFFYGYPPRRVRIPAAWTPAPIFETYLPLTLTGRPMQ